MKIRRHRGGFAESMATTETVEPTLDGVIGYLSRFMSPEHGIVQCRPVGFDTRNGWDSHLVLVDGFPVGWTDGPFHIDEATGE